MVQYRCHNCRNLWTEEEAKNIGNIGWHRDPNGEKWHNAGRPWCPNCTGHVLVPEPLPENPATVAKVVVAENPVTGEEIWVSASGAKSSEKHPAYHLIPWRYFAKRLAARYEYGQKKYCEDDRLTPNYVNGLHDRQFILDRLNHMLEHAHKAAEEIRTEQRADDDNLAAVLWGAIFLMAAQDAPIRIEELLVSDSRPQPGDENYVKPSGDDICFVCGKKYDEHVGNPRILSTPLPHFFHRR